MALRSPTLSRGPSTPTTPRPFEHAQGLIEVLPDKIDVEEEARLYEELCDTPVEFEFSTAARPSVDAPSIYSKDIWLGDHSGESLVFAREVEVVGWTNVGDKRGGAYIVYDCAIKTKEGTVIHVHKRYSAFAELYARLRARLPQSHQRFISPLPPKSPLSKFRPSFLDQRRRLLQHWLSSILLHPDIGGCEILREWVMD
ncbi:Phox homologous domain-containing protein [Fomitopsis serialis]|uniref:Phox homologous domain-containing protein n=1 Tax=Fomitopsis serialis TaxID=139415 RepID=UPI00200752B1|nr:Phox homologous domain-containing protein [Neoantrodia serialis]KAH9931914.1 Phox homologous domain-containing protein [Neoantrodia serialis]